MLRIKKKKHFFKNNKKNRKGISEVLSTLLIILLVLVSAAVIWVVVRNAISSGSEDIELGSVRLYLTIEDAYIASEGGEQIIKVTVSRDAGEGELTGIRFVLSNDENSYPINKDASITALGKRTFTFTSTEIGANVTSIKDVSVAPVYEVSGAKRTGPVTNTLKLEGSVKDKFLLTVSVIGNSYGKVVSLPSGIDCGTDCNENYDPSSLITLTATANPGYIFAGWGGDCSGTVTTCELSMDANSFVTATFQITIGIIN